MDGLESYTELLASVAGPGFARVAANDWASSSAVGDVPLPYSFAANEWPSCSAGADVPFGDAFSSGGSSGSEELSSGGEEDDVAEEDDDVVPVSDPARDAREFESTDSVQYGQACDYIASEMHDAAEAVGPETFVPPESFYIKRKRTAQGSELPNCRPPSEVGAVEAAMRASVSKKTAQIFYPTVGTVFDSLAEAYEFYNLYSWEVGFGIRYGRSNINKGNRYKSKQEIECGNANSGLESGYLADGEASSEDSGSLNGDLYHLVHDAVSFSDDQQVQQEVNEEDILGSEDIGSFNGHLDHSDDDVGSFSDHQQVLQALMEEVGDSDDKDSTNSLCAAAVLGDGDEFSEVPGPPRTNEVEDDVDSMLHMPK